MSRLANGTPKIPHDSDAGGYTLIEVIIAFVILALTLSAVFEVFSTGLRAASDADAYSTATVLAQSRLATLASDEALAVGETSGDLEGGFKWHASVAPYRNGESEIGESEIMDPFSVIPLLLTMTVRWGRGNNTREMSLVTLKLVLPR